MISPFAEQNFSAHPVADPSAILRFIEDTWNLGWIGNQLFDAVSGSILNLFDFNPAGGGFNRTLLLDPSTGEPVQRW